MTLEAFKKHFAQFQHLEFDRVLQYVAFPKIQIDLGNNLPDMRFQGSRYLVFFFQWLKEKGVERIVKVEVDDMPSKTPGHSDEAIEEALKPFGVEILNWRRMDLCPLMLSRVGENLQQVTLQWSGSNAVLRSWSEENGLSLTSNLRKIEIEHTEVRQFPLLSSFSFLFAPSIFIHATLATLINGPVLPGRVYICIYILLCALLLVNSLLSLIQILPRSLS